MGGHGYGGAGDASSGFHGGHFVHMRGLPFFVQLKMILLM